MESTVAPFLMFGWEAEAALRFQVATIPGSEVLEVTRHGPESPSHEGKVLSGRACLGGLRVTT
jgi:predicted 3-demethylubiquinone-9 3-methyltransferase (glyoxalase superfamily)